VQSLRFKDRESSVCTFGFDDPKWEAAPCAHEEYYQAVDFRDYDFDGTPDLALLNNAGAENSYSAVYLYSPKEKVIGPAEALEGAFLAPDPKRKLIHSHENLGHGGLIGTGADYRFNPKNQKFVMSLNENRVWRPSIHKWIRCQPGDEIPDNKPTHKKSECRQYIRTIEEFDLNGKRIRGEKTIVEQDDSIQKNAKGAIAWKIVKALPFP